MAQAVGEHLGLVSGDDVEQTCWSRGQLTDGIDPSVNAIGGASRVR